jgi:hypothetical protein
MLMSVAQDAAGWTVVTASADSRIIYVSNSTGNDANNGLSAATAKKTIAAGESLLRAGMPDHLLLKRGDTFTNQTLNDNGALIRNGRSAQEPIYIGTYGTGARPQILTGDEAAYRGIGSAYSNIVIQGLYFRPNTRPSFWDKACFEFVASGSNILIEDCYITEYTGGITFDGSWSNITTRRNVLVDSYNDNTSYYSGTGLYMNGVTNGLIEENTIDNNGYHPVYRPNGTIYDHAIYLQHDNISVTVRNNVLSRSPGTAVNLASDSGSIVFENNLLTHSGAGGSSGSEPTAPGLNLTFQNNVSVENESGFEFNAVIGGTISNNIIAHSTSPGGYAFSSGDHNGHVAGFHNVAITDNIFYKLRSPNYFWDDGSTFTISGATFSDNIIQEPDVDQADDPPYLISQRNTTGVAYSNNTYFRGGDATKWYENGADTYRTFAQWKSQVEPTAVQQKLNFFDPTRTTVTYAATQGLTSYGAMVAEMRNQSRTNWRTDFTADAVNDYIRAGFVLDPVGVPQLPNFSPGSPPAGQASGSESPPAPTQQAIPDAGSGSSTELAAPVAATIAKSTPQRGLNANLITVATWQPSSHISERFESTDGLLIFSSRLRNEAFAAASDKFDGTSSALQFGDSDDGSQTEDGADFLFDGISAFGESARDHVFSGYSNF